MGCSKRKLLIDTVLEPDTLITQSVLSSGQNANAASQLATGSTLQIPMDMYVHVPRYSFYAAGVANAAVLGVSCFPDVFSQSEPGQLQAHSCCQLVENSTMGKAARA